MKKLLLAATATCLALGAASAADAREGCGPGGHRGPYGHCRPNMGPAGGPVLVVGNYYHGRGYWDGRRYWWHRDRWHNGWRYR